MSRLESLMSGLVVGESPRWHDGRLWFCNWAAQEIRTVDVDGNSEDVAKRPKPAGYCIDFLPDGRLLVTGEDRLLRCEPDGSFVTHADLGTLGTGWNEVTVDGRGQHLRQRRRIQFRSGRLPATNDRAGDARGGRAPGRRQRHVHERHGRHAGQLD